MKEYHGLFRGVVKANKDFASSPHRLTVSVPQLMAAHGVPALPSFPTAAAERVLNPPEVGEGVWIMFENGDLNYPVYTGFFGGRSHGKSDPDKCDPIENERRIPPIRGVNLAPWAIGTELWEEETSDLGPTHVTVPIRIESPSLTSSAATVDSLDLVRALAYVPGNSKVIIEPYPWIDSGAASETEWNPTDKAAWETNYTAALVEVAEAFPSAWGFHVGSNLVYLEPETARWINIINAVKTAIPNARIIYRTNWWLTASWAPETITAFEAKRENPLFAEVDIIAVAAYFELMDTARPDQDEIADSLYATTLFSRFQNVYDECRQLAQRWNKPLLFGELVCAKYEGALASPWRPWNPPDVPPPVDWMIQVRYFRAVYDVFRDAEWWAGFSVYGVAYPYNDGGYNLTPAARNWLKGVFLDDAILRRH